MMAQGIRWEEVPPPRRTPEDKGNILKLAPVDKRRCNKCRKWKPATEKNFGRTKKKLLSGEYAFDGMCRTCRSNGLAGGIQTEYESDVAKMLRKAKLRARQRAWVRLAREYPKQFKELYLQELHEEGWDGDEDLRAGANRRKGEGKVSAVYCKSKVKCGWTGSRSTKTPVTKKPCPWCGGRVGKK
jgi:hypothetical protein